MRPLRPEERLIVAADYLPSECGGSQGALKKALDLAIKISGLGVYYKMNAPLRFFGCQRLVKEVHDLGLKIFADLKLIDISETMTIDAQYLQELQPDIVTVMCLAGVKGMNAVQQIIGDGCEVLGVTVLTSLNDKDCDAIFTCSAANAVLRLAKLAAKAEIGGLVMSGKELNIVSAEKELVLLSRNTPGVRPLWSVVKGDDQDPKRIVTPAEAMLNGADRIVVGRPITQAADPREAVLKTLAEIEQGIKLRKQKEKE